MVVCVVALHVFSCLRTTIECCLTGLGCSAVGAYSCTMLAKHVMGKLGGCCIPNPVHDEPHIDLETGLMCQSFEWSWGYKLCGFEWTFLTFACCLVSVLVLQAETLACLVRWWSVGSKQIWVRCSLVHTVRARVH